MVYWFFIVINIFYILFEFIFNFYLLNIVGDQKTTMDDINQIELIGRFLAASGFTLLLWKFIQAKNINYKWNKSFFVGIFITAISFYGFYITQEKVIDYTARNLSESTTKRLYNLFLLKEGLISGTVILQDIPYNEGNANTAESKTFLINLPLFMISNDKTYNYIEKNKKIISNHIYKYKVSNHPEDFEHIYREPVAKLDSVYAEYKRTSIRRDDHIRESKRIGEESFKPMHRELKKKYKYSKSRLSYQNYINTNEIKSIIKDKIKYNYNLYITRDFNPNSQQSYSNAITGTIIDAYQKEYDQKVAESGHDLNIPFGVKDRTAFYNHPKIVNFLKKEQGDFYIPLRNMGDRMFRFNYLESQQVIVDNAEKIAKAITKEHINIDLKSDEVISIVKSMIIPPIALILSLFFGFMNLFLILKMLSSKIFSYFTRHNNKLSLVFMYSCVSMLLFLPLVLNNSYTNTVSYQTIYKNMSDDNYFIAFSANWILKFEPFVYDNGNVISLKIKEMLD